MARTLVIQLGRLGDVIQTTPLLAELAAKGDKVDVLVLRSAHEPLLGFSAIANIITIPDVLKPLDDAIACGFPLGEIPAEARELLIDLQLPLYDRVINASHAPLGCWLASAISCTNCDACYGGVIRDRECFYLGPASVYRVAMLQFRVQNLFNLVDLLRAIHGGMPPPQRPCLYASQSGDLPFALPEGRRVALNPGASESARCWPAESFARLAEALFGAGFVPVLVGALPDRDLCERIQSTARVPVSNFAGRTTISEMAALLARCDLLVSADTGAAHLAAAVGTTVLGLYGASAWFAETAPYGDEHLILQTPLNAPMSTISLNAVFAGALNRLGRLSLTDLRRELQREKQLAWKTLLDASDSSDPLGGLSYRPIHDDAPTHNDAFARALRAAFATEFLQLVQGIDKTQIGSKQIEKSAAQSACDSLAQIFDRMEIVASRCAAAAEKGTDCGKIQVAAQELIAATEKLRALVSESPWKPLGPVIHNLDWRLRMLPQQEPAVTLRSYAHAYASAARVVLNTAAEQRNYTERNLKH